MSRRPALRRLALALSFLLGVGVLAGVPIATVVATPQAANAAVAGGDVVASRVPSGTLSYDVGILKSNGSFQTLFSGHSSTGSTGISANGATVVFQSNEGSIYNSGIWAVNSDGSGAHRVSPAVSDAELGTPADCIDEVPAIAPSGNLVAFNHRCSPDSNSPKIWIRNIDGTGLHKLTTETSTYNPIFESTAAFSPDGSKIVFVAYPNNRLEFFVANTDGTGTPTKLNATSSVGNVDLPTWIGTRIYFTAAPSGSYGTYWINDNGTGSPTLVTPASLNCMESSPSSDGSNIVCASGGQLYRVNVSTQAYTQISSPGSSNYIFGQPSQVPAAFPTATAPTVVNLGDSVAAGEGIGYGFVWDGSKWVQTGPDNPTWTDTTATLGINIQNCHQTGYSYGRLLYASNNKVSSMACSGATTMGILAQQVFGDGTAAPAQLGGTCSGCKPANPRYDALNPDRVTLTVTANDIDFAGWVKKCYTPNALGCNSPANTNTVNAALATAKTNLRKVFTELNRRAALAHKTVFVVVTNYYNPLPLGTTSCVDTSAWAGAIGITTAEKTWLGGKLGVLNSNIASEVTYAQQHDPSLKVRLADVSGLMNIHRFCDHEPWAYGPSIDFPTINDLNGNDNPAPFHPTKAGQNAIYGVVKAAFAAG